MQGQPNPTDPNLNPPPIYLSIGNLLKELSSQPLASIQQLLHGFQLDISRRGLNANANLTPNPNSNLSPNLLPNSQPNLPGNPTPINPNGNHPPSNPNGSSNSPNPPKVNETIIDPDKLGVTIAKAN